MSSTAKPRAIELDPGEYALIVGEEDGQMTVRIEAAEEPTSEDVTLPPAAEIVVALAQRLLRDPDFHDEVVEWLDEQPDEEDEEEEDEGHTGH